MISRSIFNRFSPSVLWRILGLVILTQALSIVVILLFTFNGPPPVAAPYRTDDIVNALQGRPLQERSGLEIGTSILPAAPNPGPDWIERTDYAPTLARLLNVAETDIRVFVPRQNSLPRLMAAGSTNRGPGPGPNEPPREPPRNMSRPGDGPPPMPPPNMNGERPPPMPPDMGEAPRMGSRNNFRTPMSLRDGFMIGVREGETWRVIATALPPLFTEWHYYLFGIVGATFLLLMVPAYLIARRISRPLARLAQQASHAKPGLVAAYDEADGPPEVRQVASAFKRLHDALNRYLQDRTLMLGAIAHDLRTPLMRVAFRIEQLPDAERERAMNDIAEMREMISATLDFMAGQAELKNAVRLDLSSLVASLVDNQAATGARVQMGDLEKTIVRGDMTALRRLFTNLIENALRYAGHALVKVQTTPTEAIVIVDDEGPGMPAHLIEKAFKPFFRTEESRNRYTGGIGLGLSIAQAITEAHGGKIELLNRPEGGFRVIVKLPLYT
jgi:signal transduction histidine kinase